VVEVDLTARSFLNPITQMAESSKARSDRMLVWRLLRESLVNHPHIISQVEHGKVAELVKLAREFALGSAPDLHVANGRALYTLAKGRNQTWSQFAARVQTLHAKMYQPSGDPGFNIGRRAFVHCVLNACSDDPSLVTERGLGAD
jgi:hypothetical protein